MSVVALKPLAHVLAVLLAAAALVAVAPTRAHAAGTPCQRTFASGPVDVPIADNAVTPLSIDVPEDGLVVSDVDVAVDLHHTFVSDLGLDLFSTVDGGGDRAHATLFDHSDDPGQDILGAVFDDSATTPVTWSQAPYTGRFKPLKPLAALNGFAGGTYLLHVFDAAPGDTGTLNDWSVTLTYASCDLDADGVEDHADSCLGLSAHTATGCPLTSRSAAAKYKNGRFKGALASPVGGCAAGRAVSIWKVRDGADKLVGTATTGGDGSYRLKRARHAGRYYATSPLVAVTDSAECPAVTSKTFKVR
jgi:subtilisin-like proprotein convertase family protein